MHPWHDVAIGDRAPEIVPVVVEVDSKVLEKKTVTVEDFLDRHEALPIVRRAIDLYARERTRLRV